jgi:hypothetical protein
MNNYTCVCKVLLLCSVMSAVPVPSKNCLERSDNITYSSVLNGCVTEHRQAVTHSACAELSVEMDQLGKIFIVSTKYRD